MVAYHRAARSYPARNDPLRGPPVNQSSESDTGMENESARVAITQSGSGQKSRTPDNREYIIQSCYDLLSRGLPLTAVLEEAKRLSNPTEINRPSIPCKPDLLQALEAVRVEKRRRVRLPRLALFTSFWIVTAMCSMAMIGTAVIAVVTHLPAAAEATLPITPSSAAQPAASATSSELVVLLAEVSPDPTPSALGQESFANAPTPMSNLFEDFAREHPLEVTHDHGLARSADSRCPCGRVVEGRVHARFNAKARYAPRPAFAHSARRANYRPTYNHLISGYGSHPQANGFDELGHSKSVWTGTLPHRVRVADDVLEYDSLIGRYVPLAGVTPR